MNKLELHHIAKRLPYGLKIMNTYISDGYVFENDKITEMGVFSDSYDTDSPKLSIAAVIEHQFKPILRPLNDLTKEIEHDGETFVPLNKLNYECNDCGTLEFDKQKISGCVYLNIYQLDSENGNEIASFIDVYNKLLEWHFDVDSLIPQGLAISVNDLKENPYE